MYYECRITGKSSLYMRQCQWFGTNNFAIRCSKPQQQIASFVTCTMTNSSSMQQHCRIATQRSSSKKQKYITDRYKHIRVRRTAACSSMGSRYPVVNHTRCQKEEMKKTVHRRKRTEALRWEMNPRLYAGTHNSKRTQANF